MVRKEVNGDDDFGGLLPDAKVNFTEADFRRTLQTCLGQAQITNMLDDIAGDLYYICREYVLLYRVAAKARRDGLKSLYDDRRHIIAAIEKYTAELRRFLKAAKPGRVCDSDNLRLERALKGVDDAAADVEARWRAVENLAEISRGESSPGSLSAELNEYLRLSHRDHWPQQQHRNQIIVACLQACNIYSPDDADTDPHSVEMQLSRAKAKAEEEFPFERMVHTAEGLRKRKSRGSS